jgi:hypothetical protein
MSRWARIWRRSSSGRVVRWGLLDDILGFVVER